MDLEKQSDGYTLYLKSNYSPEAQKQVHDLYKILNITERTRAWRSFSGSLPA
jgi:hypothetical protein